MNTAKQVNIILIGWVLSLLPVSAYAHTGTGHLSGVIDGFSHPFLGVDHLLVMISIGLWAAVSKGYRVCLFPVVFLLAMTVGAIFNFMGIEIAGMERGVALSVLLCGFILLWNKHLSTSVASSLISLFAISHGYVHAAEISHQSGAGGYVTGFLLATTLLLAIGILTGFFSLVIQKQVRNIFGWICTFAGIAFLVSI